MMPAGAIGVHSGIWFADNGLSSTQIGIVNAVPVLILLGLNLTIGRLADRANDWRATIMIGAFVQAVATLGLFAVDTFWGILAVWTSLMIPNQGIMPVVDAATVRLTRRRGSSYGAIRACATVGYLLAVYATGLLITHVGPDTYVPIMVAVAMLKALSSLALPRFRSPEERRADQDAEPLTAGRLADVMHLPFVLPVIGFALVYATHSILNYFGALLWKSQGISSAVIGQLIVISALAEAVLMVFWSWRRVPPGPTMAVIGVIALLRWWAMAYAPPVPVLMGLQLLHAFTFGLGYLAIVQFIAERTDDRIAAEAQSFYAIAQSAMIVISVFLFGLFVDRVGFGAYFVAAGLSALGVVLILAGLMSKNPLPRSTGK